MTARRIVRAALLALLVVPFLILYAGVALLDWASRAGYMSAPSELETTP